MGRQPSVGSVGRSVGRSSAIAPRLPQPLPQLTFIIVPPAAAPAVAAVTTGRACDAMMRESRRLAALGVGRSPPAAAANLKPLDGRPALTPAAPAEGSRAVVVCGRWREEAAARRQRLATLVAARRADMVAEGAG